MSTKVTTHSTLLLVKSPHLYIPYNSAGCTLLVQENPGFSVSKAYPRVALEFCNIFGIRQEC